VWEGKRYWATFRSFTTCITVIKIV
jgi:hypothetical protein